MSSLEVISQSGSYEIRFDNSEVVEFSSGLVLCDANVPNSLVKSVPAILKIEASEAVKNLATVEQIVSAMSEEGTTRGGQLNAIGGGVIQDLATLSASIYMRGVPWIYYPSTLASMIDSCVGGKSSLNTPQHKNLIGNFFPPKSVVINTRFIESLPIDEYICGLAEGVKICFAKGNQPFQSFVANPAAHIKSVSNQLEQLISLSLTSKIWFIEIDEYDRKERQFLNFGHSFGHALESASKYRIPHGVAVAIGMLAATNPSWGDEDPSISELRGYLFSLLANWTIRNKTLDYIDWSLFEVAIRQDKKNTEASIRLILARKAGALYVCELPKNQETLSRLRMVTHATIQELLAS